MWEEHVTSTAQQEQKPVSRLEDLSKKEYEALKASGFMWEFYPEATGDWYNDTHTR